MATLYLESYVESTQPLPADLHRLHLTIKALDYRASDLMEVIRSKSDTIMALPPHGQRNAKEDQVGAGGAASGLRMGSYVGASMGRDWWMGGSG